MDSHRFKAEVSQLVREEGGGLNAKLRASRGLVEGLEYYFTNFICKYEQSPILNEIRRSVFELDSINPLKVQRAASHARDLCLDFVRRNSSSPFVIEVIMLQLVMNGLFAVNPGMREAAQSALGGGLDLIWNVLDDGYVFGLGLYGSDEGYAEKKMQELFAYAQITTGLSYC